MKIKTLTLTGNDIALASFAVGHAISFHKHNGGSPAYRRKEIEKHEALIHKLSAILDLAHPAGCYDDGEDMIVATVPQVMRVTRARSRRLAKDREA